MLDIQIFMRNFPEISTDDSLEIISSLNEQLLERIKDKELIRGILNSLCEENSYVLHTIVTDLFRKAERSGDIWYLSTGLQLQQQNEDNEDYPLKEMVKVGISVARASNDMQVLKDLIPIIDRNKNLVHLSKTYLQFSLIMLSSGDFDSALEIFNKIIDKTEFQSQYFEGLSDLMKLAVVKDRILQIKDSTLKQLDREAVNNVTYRTVVEISKDQPMREINSHINSIKDLISLHPKKDQIFLEFITNLINRGFLDENDPAVLIKFVEFITDPTLKEQAISTIVIKIARIGGPIKKSGLPPKGCRPNMRN